MICMAALLMMAVSCKKENKTSDKGEGFRATIESHSGDSKTHLEGLAVKWDNGDAIKVLSNTCTEGADFSTDATSSPALFEATGDLPANFYTPSYTAYYPAASFSGSLLTLPPTQQYDENNTFASGANPMAAASSETLLPFKNVCGVLKLQLYSTTACQVQSISITSNNGEQLCGTGTVTLTGGVPALGTLSNGGSTLTLDMGSTGKPMGANESAPTAYYFVVPAGTLGTSFTVKVTETNGKVWSKTANAHQNLIARSQITVLPEQAVATHTPVIPTVTTIVGCVDCTYTFSGEVTVSGTHLCEYGFVYAKTADNADPTIGGTGCVKFTVNTENLSDSKDFTADLLAMGLEQDVEYTVKAYGICDAEAYGTKQTYVYSLPKPLPSSWTNGKNPHPFTVGMDDEKPRIVYFSQGNLQYLAQSGSGGNASATAASGANVGGTWRFAEHQFDMCDKNTTKNHVTSDYTQASTKWIDLFGWGTSGYNHGGICYQPWSTSMTTNEYYAYSTSIHTYNLYDQSGMADWGKANAISNGGNQAGKWRTLTGDSNGEWDYLINSRSDAANLYGEGKVGNCTPGLIILPDDWSLPAGLSFTPGKSDYSNVYSYSQWAQMEAAGAVFLPAAGLRDGTSVRYVGESGLYWSSSYNNNNRAGDLYFLSGDVRPSIADDRRIGRSVRLVSEN